MERTGRNVSALFILRCSPKDGEDSAASSSSAASGACCTVCRTSQVSSMSAGNAYVCRRAGSTRARFDCPRFDCPRFDCPRFGCSRSSSWGASEQLMNWSWQLDARAACCCTLSVGATSPSGAARGAAGAGAGAALAAVSWAVRARGRVVSGAVRGVAWPMWVALSWEAAQCDLEPRLRVCLVPAWRAEHVGACI